MPERSLALLAAGTKHTVWRICEADGSPSGRILRIPKQAGSETPTEGESSFVQTVLVPLLGSQFVHPSLARLSFPERLIREFHDAAQRGEGVSAAEASEVIAAADAASGGTCRPPGTEVLVETDHTVLRLCAAGEPCARTATAAAAPACTPALCLELKPKAGVLASGPLGEAAWSKCRPGGATARAHGLLGPIQGPTFHGLGLAYRIHHAPWAPQARRDPAAVATACTCAARRWDQRPPSTARSICTRRRRRACHARCARCCRRRSTTCASSAARARVSTADEAALARDACCGARCSASCL